MIKTLACDIKNYDDPKDNPALFANMPNWIRETTLRYKPELSRKLHFYSWYFLRDLFRELGISLDSVYFGEQGKPYSDDIYFSISHSGTLIFVVVSDKEVGCDIEEIKTFPEEIKEKVFSEYDLYNNDSYEDMNSIFYCIWSAKESYLKLIGTGLRNDLHSVEVDIINEYVLDLERNKRAHLSTWYENGYSFAICFE